MTDTRWLRHAGAIAVTGETMKTIDATEPWAEPDDWQDGAPAVFAREDAVYMSDPATKRIPGGHRRGHRDHISGTVLGAQRTQRRCRTS